MTIYLGTGGNDTLIGLDDIDDEFRGGLGDDILVGGGSAFDWASYTDAPSAVTVNLATGTSTGGGDSDTLDGIEGVYGSSHNDIVIGDDNDNSLDGGDGDDWLVGGLGNDILYGGKGFDWVDYSNAASSVTLNLSTFSPGTSSGGEDNDTLYGFEAVMGSDYNDNIAGNILSNVLNGGSGNDKLNGGIGVDTLIGGSGNDTFLIDNTGDIVNENFNEGTDKVNSKVTYTLPENVENLTLKGTLAINGVGNDLANKLTGNSAANQMSGGAGNDILNGGAGVNTLAGGTGKDIFRFTTTGHIDVITDFTVIDDTIQLEKDIFTAFTTIGTLAMSHLIIGTQALDANDFIVYDNVAGTLLYDADGNESGIAIQIAILGNGLNITNADIVVI